MNKIQWLGVLLIAGLFSFLYWVQMVGAWDHVEHHNDYLKVICHHNPTHAVTLTFHTPQAYAGHLGTPHNNQTFDADGRCVAPTTAPTVVPTATPTPTGVEECDWDKCEPTVTPTPTVVEEEPTPTPTEETKVGGDAPTFAASSTEAPGVCSDTVPGVVANLNVDSGQPNDGKVTVEWSIPENADRIALRFSEDDGLWRYGALGLSNSGNYEVSDLVNGQHYWFQVAGQHGCAIGPWSSSFDPLP